MLTRCIDTQDIGGRHRLSLNPNEQQSQLTSSKTEESSSEFLSARFAAESHKSHEDESTLQYNVTSQLIHLRDTNQCLPILSRNCQGAHWAGETPHHTTAEANTRNAQDSWVIPSCSQ